MTASSMQRRSMMNTQQYSATFLGSHRRRGGARPARPAPCRRRSAPAAARCRVLSRPASGSPAAATRATTSLGAGAIVRASATAGRRAGRGLEPRRRRRSIAWQPRSLVDRGCATALRCDCLRPLLGPRSNRVPADRGSARSAAVGRRCAVASALFGPLSEARVQRASLAAPDASHDGAGACTMRTAASTPGATRGALADGSADTAIPSVRHCAPS